MVITDYQTIVVLWLIWKCGNIDIWYLWMSTRWVPHRNYTNFYMFWAQTYFSCYCLIACHNLITEKEGIPHSHFKYTIHPQMDRQLSKLHISMHLWNCIQYFYVHISKVLWIFCIHLYISLLTDLFYIQYQIELISSDILTALTSANSHIPLLSNPFRSR